MNFNFEPMLKIGRTGVTFLSKNSTHILTGFGVAGVVSTALLTHKAAKLSYSELDPSAEEQPTKAEFFAENWQHYIPAVLSGTAAIACIIAAHTIDVRRHAALAAAYTLSQEAYSSYRDEIAELLGEDKADNVESSIIERMQPDAGEAPATIVVGNGDVTFYDPLTGRTFSSSLERVRKVINDLNYDLTRYDGVSLNDLYSHLGLQQTTLGDELGWSAGASLLEADYHPIMLHDGRPAVAVKVTPEPRTDWFKLS